MTERRHAPFAIGRWLVEPDRNRISSQTCTLYVRPQVMDVLVYLAGLEGQVASLETMHDELWAGKVVSSGTLYNCVAELRQLLAQDGSGLTYIETIPKKGYRLAAPLVSRESDAGFSAGPGRPAVAILPLENRGKNPRYDYLSEGVAEEILHRLSKVHGLRVYSALKLKDAGLDPRVIGLRMSATAILTGSLRTDGTRLQLTFLLESVADGAVIWADRYAGEMADIFDMQAQVADQVVTAMSSVFNLQPPQSCSLQGSGTRNPAALNAFLLGKHLESRFSRRSCEEAIQALETAVALDPCFARAHYILHQLHYSMYRDFGCDESHLDKARAAAADARKYGYQLPVPWVCIQRRLYPESRLDTRGLALEALDRIRARDPEWRTFAYEQLSWVLPVSGHFQAALEFALRSLDAPDHNYQDSDAEHLVPMYYGAVGQFTEAIRILSIEIQRDPTSNLFRRRRCVMYARTGHLDYARHDADALETGQERDLTDAFYYFYLGNHQAVRRCHARLLEVEGLHPNLAFFSHMLVGEPETAIGHYVEAATSPLRGYVELGPLRVWTRFYLPPGLVDQVERHPGFRALMDREGIGPDWCSELEQRVNELSGITGISIPDDACEGQRARPHPGHAPAL